MSEVKFIKYRDKDHPVRVSYWATKKFKEETGMNFGGDYKYNDEGFITLVEGKEFKMEHYELLLFYALKAGKKAKDDKIEIDFTKDDMEFILDECMHEFMEMVRDFTAETLKAQGLDPEDVKQGKIQKQEGAPEGNVTQNRRQRRAGQKKQGKKSSKV